MNILEGLEQYKMKPKALVVRLADGQIEMRPPDSPKLRKFFSDVVEAYLLVLGLDDFKKSEDKGVVLVRVEFMDRITPVPSASLLRHLCEVVFPDLIAEAKPKAIAIYAGGEYFQNRFGMAVPYFWSVNGPEPGFTNLLKQTGA